MTNEVLVERIQAGEKDLIPQLWGQVEKFVSQQAGIRARQLGGLGGVSEDDLYQSGFLALIAAIETYNPEKGMAFIGWLAFHLKNAFRAATGYQTDALQGARSLDAALNDEDEVSLADTIADPTDLYEATEEQIFQQQLRHKLKVALNTIPEEYSSTLSRRYFQNQTLKQIGEQDGITINAARQREGLGLRKLRHPRISKELRQFIEERTPYYMRVGVTSFQNSHSSAVEEIVMLRERLIRGA